MEKSLIQVYQDISGKTLFVQIMKTDALEERRKESKELNFNLDDISGGTEKIYGSDIPYIKLNKSFFVEIVKAHRDWRKDESASMMLGEDNKTQGVSYPFFPEHYEQLNKEIENKLGLKAK